jgi:glutamate synthase domain-containing protein 3
MKNVIIDAKDMHYTPLNRMIRQAVQDGAEEIVLDNILGQRFIADGLTGDVTIRVNGVPGGDLGMFMNGPTCIVRGNCDHAPGNTMDSGKIVIHGSAGDAVAHSMRGGKVYVRDDIGYRGGIHMKEYGTHRNPVLIVGNTSQSFLGEYMAGGKILVLGTDSGIAVDGRGIGSGIHGGEIIIRGEVPERRLGVGAKIVPFTEEDLERVKPLILEFCDDFAMEPEKFLNTEYTRIIRSSSRPFAGKYTWE